MRGTRFREISYSTLSSRKETTVFAACHTLVPHIYTLHGQACTILLDPVVNSPISPCYPSRDWEDPAVGPLSSATTSSYRTTRYSRAKNPIVEVLLRRNLALVAWLRFSPYFRFYAEAFMYKADPNDGSRYHDAVQDPFTRQCHN
jgi:hypothetical protein